MNKIKQIKKLFVFTLLIAGSVLLSGLLTTQDTHAITCDYSNNGSGDYKSGMGYSGRLTYNNGSCVLMKPDTAEGGNRPNVDGSCSGIKNLKWEGQCYQPRAEYTNLKPTNDDGTEVPSSTFDTICGQTSSGSWMHFTGGYHYNSSRNRCESGNGCMGLDSDSIDGDCRAIGKDTPTPEDVKYQDETTATVKECTGAGAQFDPKSHECKWTPETCGAKNGGQGYWDKEYNQCRGYSDNVTAEDCQKAGGDFQQDSSDASHWECKKPGTKITPSPSASPNVGLFGGVPGEKPTRTCGEARVNLIACDPGSRGASAFNGLLQIGLRILTAVVGVAAVGGIAWGSVLYAKAGDNEGQVSEAKTLIQDVIIGLILYGFLLAIVNWILPTPIFIF